MSNQLEGIVFYGIPFDIKELEPQFERAVMEYYCEEKDGLTVAAYGYGFDEYCHFYVAIALSDTVASNGNPYRLRMRDMEISREASGWKEKIIAFCEKYKIKVDYGDIDWYVAGYYG